MKKILQIISTISILLFGIRWIEPNESVNEFLSSTIYNSIDFIVKWKKGNNLFIIQV